MADEPIVEQNEDLTDEEIAELASKQINEKNKEISKLKKELARQKLLTNAPEEEKPVATREDCIKVISNPNSCNYDYAKAVVDFCEIEKAEGRPNPLGENGEAVQKLFEEVIEDCDGNKENFTSIYQAKLAPDDKKIAMSFQKRK